MTKCGRGLAVLCAVLFLFLGRHAWGDNINPYIIWQQGQNTTADVALLTLFPFNDGTIIQLYGTNVSDVQIDQPGNLLAVGNFPLAGTGFGGSGTDGQPWAPINKFASEYFYVKSNSPVIWQIEDDLYSSSYGCDTWLTSTNATCSGTRFFTHLEAVIDDPVNPNVGDNIAVVNNNAFNVTVSLDKWNGAGWTNLTAGNVVQANGIWMIGGSTMNPLYPGATGTVLADAGDYRITATGGNVCVWKGFLGNASNVDCWCVSPDMGTGLKYGTNLIGVDSIQYANNYNIILSAPAGGPAVNYQIFQYVPTGGNPAYPVQNYMVGNTNSGTWIVPNRLWVFPAVLGANVGVIQPGTSVFINGISGNNRTNFGALANFYNIQADHPIQAVLGDNICSLWGATDWFPSSDQNLFFSPDGNDFIVSWSGVPSPNTPRYISTVLANPGTTATLTTFTNGSPLVAYNGIYGHTNNPMGTITGIPATNSYAQTSTVPNEPLVWQVGRDGTQYMEETFQFTITNGTGCCFFSPEGEPAPVGAVVYDNNAWVMSGIATGVTATFTSTPTCTATATDTSTPGPSQTSTNTPTVSPTPTITNTSTDTGTPSATSTPTVLLSPTNTDTVTVSGTATDTSTITLTPTVTITSSQTLTSSLTFTPSKSFTQTNTATVTATSTPVMTDLRLKIYNEAGEVVKTFNDVLVLGALSGIQLASGSGSVNFDPSSGIFDIEVQSKGNVYHVPWDGKSDLGNTVDSGGYVLKGEVPGQDATITMPVTVFKAGNLLTIGVYTPSGELVKQLYESYLVLGQLGSMKLSTNVLTVNDKNKKTVSIGIGAVSETGTSYLEDDVGFLDLNRIFWDGTNSLGSFVQSGEYLVKIEQTYNHNHDVVVQSVTVLVSSFSGFMDASVYPNPYISTPDQKVWFKVTLQDNADVRVRIYDVVGELVNTLSSPGAGPGPASLGWYVGGVASGLYIGVVEAKSLVSGEIQKKQLKISIVK